MARVLTTLHLSDIQKEVLCKVKASANPQLAWEEISGAADTVDDNFATSRDLLGNLGLLTVGDGTLEVAEQGEQVMKDENLTDESGELTEEGRALADIPRGEGEKQEQAAAQAPAPGGEEDMGMGMPPEGGGEEEMGLPLESLKLIRSLQDEAELVLQQRLLEDR